MRKRMIEILLVGILLVLLFVYKKRNKSNEDLAIIKGVAAIGTVTENSPPGYYSAAHTNFKFYTKSKQQIFISGFKCPENRIKEGDRFLVLYLPEKPKIAVMLFDHPIKDSTDFRRYVKEIEEMRKRTKK